MLRLRQTARDRETKTARSRARWFRGRSIKRCEYAISLGDGNAGPAIGNPEDKSITIDTGRNFDRSSRGRVLECVVYEIAQYSQGVDEVESPEGKCRRIVEGDIQPILIRPARNLLDHGTKEVVGGVDLNVERQRSTLETRDFQQISDESVQAIGLLLNDERPLIAKRLELVGESFDRCQRCSQIVGEGGQQCVLEFIRFAQRFRSLHRGPLRSRAVKELCGHDTGNEEDEKYEPIERVSYEERVVRWQEEPIESQKCGQSGGHPQNPATGSTRAEHNQQEYERNVGFPEVAPDGQQRKRSRHQGQKRESPNGSARAIHVIRATGAPQIDIRPQAP
jgi:hypothetical protein